MGDSNMIINGTVEYNNNGELTEKKICIDTGSKTIENDEYIYDAVSFALYGKTIYHNIVSSDTGVPLIILRVECKGKSAYLVRQPQYYRETHFGTRYLSKEVFSIKTETEEHDALSSEAYYKLLDKYIDMSFDEFSDYTRRDQ